jgi:predicted nucleic acid-binding Zn ribbon protein
MISGLKRSKRCEICGTRVNGPGQYCAKCQDDLNEIQLRAKRHKAPMGRVYVIGVVGDSDSVIKIGYARSVEERLKVLQIGSPVMLEVIASADGRISHEQRLHRMLMASKSHGEWFRRTPEVIRMVDIIRSNQLLEWFAERGPRARAIKHLREQIGVV